MITIQKNTTGIFKKPLLVILLMALSSYISYSATITSANSGSWDDTNTWDGGIIPDENDDVIIDSGHTIEVSQNTACGSLAIHCGSAGQSTLLSISPGVTLTVSGNLSLNSVDDAYLEVSIRGTLTVTGNINFNAATASTINVRMDHDNSRLNIGGNMNLSSAGTLTNSSDKKSIVNFNGSSAQTLLINTNFTYHDILFNNSHSDGVTSSAAINSSRVLGNITVESGKFRNGGFATAGNTDSLFTVKNGATFVLMGSNMPTGFKHVLEAGSTIEFVGGNQIINSPNNSQVYHHLTVSGTNTKTLLANLTVNGDLKIISSTLDVNSNANYSINLKGDWLNTGGNFNPRKGVVSFTGTGIQQIASNGQAFKRLTIDNSAGTTLSGSLQVDSVLTLTNGVITTGSDMVILTSTDPAHLAGYSNTRFINGTLRRYIAENTETYAFPIGNGTGSGNYFWIDVINNNLSGTTYIDGKYRTLQNHDNNDMNVTEDELTYLAIVGGWVWELVPDAEPSGGSYDVKIPVRMTSHAAICRMMAYGLFCSL